MLHRPLPLQLAILWLTRLLLCGTLSCTSSLSYFLPSSFCSCLGEGLLQPLLTGYRSAAGSNLVTDFAAYSVDAAALAKSAAALKLGAAAAQSRMQQWSCLTATLFSLCFVFVARVATAQASTAAAAASKASSPCLLRPRPLSQRWPTEVLFLCSGDVVFVRAGTFHSVAGKLPSCATEKSVQRQLRRLAVHAPFLGYLMYRDVQVPSTCFRFLLVPFASLLLSGGFSALARLRHCRRRRCLDFDGVYPWEPTSPPQPSSCRMCMATRLLMCLHLLLSARTQDKLAALLLAALPRCIPWNDWQRYISMLWSSRSSTFRHRLRPSLSLSSKPPC